MMKLIQSATMLVIVFAGASEGARNSNDRPIATFSIVARDSVTGELGAAVASKFFTVGNVVPWAKAGVGAVATQAYCNTSFGWRGLELLESGIAPEQAKNILLKDDNDPTRRQLDGLSPAPVFGHVTRRIRRDSRQARRQHRRCSRCGRTGRRVPRWWRCEIARRRRQCRLLRRGGTGRGNRARLPRGPWCHSKQASRYQKS